MIRITHKYIVTKNLSDDEQLNSASIPVDGQTRSGATLNFSRPQILSIA